MIPVGVFTDLTNVDVDVDIQTQISIKKRINFTKHNIHQIIIFNSGDFYFACVEKFHVHFLETFIGMNPNPNQIRELTDAKGFDGFNFHGSTNVAQSGLGALDILAFD